MTFVYSRESYCKNGHLTYSIASYLHSTKTIQNEIINGKKQNILTTLFCGTIYIELYPLLCISCFKLVYRPGYAAWQHLQLGDTNSKKALVFLCICLFCTSVLFLYEQKKRLILKVAKSKLLNFRKISLWFKSPKSLPNHNPEHLQLLFRLILLRVVIWQILEI